MSFSNLLDALYLFNLWDCEGGAGSPHPSGWGMKAESFALITFAPLSTDIILGMRICIRMMISYKYPIFPNKITQWKLAGVVSRS
jgi:hypothetical protein